MRPSKVVAIVIGALLLIVGFFLLVPGIFLLTTFGALKDESGFRQTSTRAVSTNGYALVSPQVDLNFGPPSWVPTGGTAAVRVVASGGPRAVFVGIGPSDRVAEYLRGVAYDEVAEFG
jgi:hypothetical protein